MSLSAYVVVKNDGSLGVLIERDGALVIQSIEGRGLYVCTVASADERQKFTEDITEVVHNAKIDALAVQEKPKIAQSLFMRVTRLALSVMASRLAMWLQVSSAACFCRHFRIKAFSLDASLADTA